MLKTIGYLVMLLILHSDVAQAQYTWKRGQQVMVIPETTAPVAVSDSMKVIAVARTSAGVPVTSPAITWNLRDSSGISVIKSTNSSMWIFPLNVPTTKTTWLVGSWRTSSGTFRDSVAVTINPYVATMRFYLGPINRTQTWRSGQQLMIRPSHNFTTFLPAPLSGGSITMRVSARTSGGVPVSGFRATWRLRDTTAASLVVLSDSSARVFNKTNTGYVSWVVASWATRSGIIRDSVKLLISPIKEKAFLAFNDSFPNAKRIVVFAAPYGHKSPTVAALRDADIKNATTAADSAFLQREWAVIIGSADSIGVDVHVDTVSVARMSAHLLTVPLRFNKGFEYSLCLLAKNRFNGTVRLLAPTSPTGQTKCAGVRLAYESQP
jgi:hypothetical protein